tara:strand:- start:1575 stop:2309 length:735 start_codon:yes stop_codon:yes gene_type:complete
LATRKKTKFENLFSFKQLKRQFGSKDLKRDNVDYKELKSTLINTNKTVYTHGSENNLKSHLANLRNEFNGKSELEYYHAELNVFLRRGINPKDTFRKFSELWKNESDFLIKNLNTRWLISATDSFIDHDTNPLSRAYAFSAICLVNSCKLCETERFASNYKNIEYDPIKLEQLKKERIPLFDGTSAFTIGTCDTLRNMRWRLDAMKEPLPSYWILREIFNRINKFETVYSRMSKQHTNKNTLWW